jgi:uncharacterized protein YjaG (DUF416 family)
MHTLIKINHDSPLRFGKEILQSGLAFNIYDIQLTVDACMLLEDAHLLHIFLLEMLLLLLGLISMMS